MCGHTVFGGCLSDAYRIQYDYDDSTIKSCCQFVSMLCDTFRVSFRVSFGCSQIDIVASRLWRNTLCRVSKAGTSTAHTRNANIAWGSLSFAFHMAVQCGHGILRYDTIGKLSPYQAKWNFSRQTAFSRMIQRY